MTALREEALSPEQTDALREVANILMGHATTALARLANMRIDIEIPQIRVVSLEEGLSRASGGAGIVAGVRTRLLGTLSGEMYITFPRDSAFALTDVVRGLPPGHTRYLSGSAAAALVEVGNVIAGSCLAAFYQLLGISVVHSVPEFVYDAPEALLSAETQAVERDDNILFAQVTFNAPEVNLSGHLILLFSVESLSVLFQALEIGP